MKAKLIRAASAAVLLGAAAAGAEGVGAPGQAVLVVVQIPLPAAIAATALPAAFARAVPEYERLNGLDYKIFTVSDDGRRFGGIYLWRDREAAEAWFSPAWHARVLERYGVPGEVRVFAVEGIADTRPAADRRRVVLDAPAVATLDFSTPVSDRTTGLLRRCSIVDANGRRGQMLLWADRAAAVAAGATERQSFSAPVLMPAVSARGEAR
ncbi:MAG TPA: YdhR family protein [Albitalea sp.]|uniref:YdhR family protein n=1 Tax=Piscinibacter sp. TaxID=1903157 RepID=UPI002ED4F0E1